jgi:multiple sugar transport system permease protein
MVSTVKPVNGPPPRAKGASLARGEAMTAYLLIAPNLLIYAIFTVVPVVFSLILAFTDWNFVSGLKGLKLIGLENFLSLPKDTWFTQSLRNNLVFTLVVPASMAMGLLCALLLNSFAYLRPLLRAMIFMPFISSAVAVAIVWLVILHPTAGPVNSFLMSVGIENPPRWTGTATWALPTVMIATLWAGLGYDMMIYLAGLQGIPQDLYEAAQIDGATDFRMFRHITFPLLWPTTFFLLVTGVIGSFKAFALINVMTQGGPGTATTMLAFYVYRAGFVFYRMGYASAVAWVLMVLVFFITLLQTWGQRRIAEYQ